MILLTANIQMKKYNDCIINKKKPFLYNSVGDIFLKYSEIRLS